MASTTDSLIIQLSSENDLVKKARLYAKLSGSYPDQFDSSLYYSQRFLLTATQSSDTFLLADAYYQLADLYYYHNLDSALHYAWRYHETALLTGDAEWIAYGHDLLAYIYSEKGNVARSLEQYSKALDYFTLAGDSARMAASNINIGFTLSFGYRQADALSYFFKGMTLAENCGDTLILSDAYFNVAYYYYRTKDYEASFNSYNQALQLGLKVQEPDSGGLSLTYALLAQVSLKLNNNEFERFMLLSKQLSKHVTSAYDQANLYSSYLENYLEAQLVDSSSFYLKQVESILSKNHFSLLEAYTFQHKGRLQYLLGNYQQSIHCLQQSIERFNELQSSESFADTYQYIARAYAALNHYQQAYHWQLKANSHKDSLNLGAVERLLTEHEQNQIYESELKRKALEMELEQQQLINAELHFRNRVRIFWAAIMALMTFIVFSIFYYRSKSRNHQQILEQKAIIETQKVELEIRNAALLKSEKRLKELNSTKDKFFSIIAHDLRNPFHSIIGLTEIIVKRKDEMDAEKSYKMVESIHKTARQGHSLLENLLEWSKSQSGKMIIQLEILYPQAILNDLLPEFGEMTKSKQVKFEFTNNSKSGIMADKNMLTTVFRNLLHNALKFSYEQGTIRVLIEEQNDSLNIHIKDEGVGISENNLSKIFSIDSQVLKTGTHMEKGSGLGLILCKEFVEKNHGKIRVESKLNEGSCFTVSFPLAI